jgi:hypothetical protein
MTPSKYVAPRTVENLQQVSKALRDIQEGLDLLSRSGYTLGLATTDFSPLAPSYTRVSPPVGGLKVVLPRPAPENAGLCITLAIENPSGNLTIHAANGTRVNGAATSTFSVAGVIELFSNGVDQWASTAQLPGPAGSPGPSGASSTAPTVFFGIDGQDGADGFPGRDGQPGTQGPPGADGIIGRNGFDGQDGINGQDGFPGRDGTDGSPGSPGIQGPPGFAFDGQDGQQGDTGFPGAQGIQGLQGPAGVGIQGPAGPLFFNPEQVNDDPQFLGFPGDEFQNWTQVLFRGRNTAGLDPQISTGDYIEFGNTGTGTLPGSGDIRGRSTLLIQSRSDMTVACEASAGIATFQSGLGALCQVVGGSCLINASGTTLDTRSVDTTTLTNPLTRITRSGGLGGFLAIGESASSVPTVAAGDGMFWTQASIGTTPRWTDDENVDWFLGFGAVAVIVADVTITAATATAVVSFPVPANVWQAGATYEFYAACVFTHTATATSDPVFALQLNSTPQVSVIHDLPATAGQVAYEVTGAIVCRTTGVAGTSAWTLDIKPSSATAALLPTQLCASYASGVTLNTTAIATIRLTFHLNTTTAVGTTVTFQNAYIKRVR